jgi:hypothetical protein
MMDGEWIDVLDGMIDRLSERNSGCKKALGNYTA